MSIKREIIIWVLLLVSLTFSVFTFFSKGASFNEGKDKVGYVNITSVFEGFEMKQEMQQKLEEDLREKQSSLDSLMFQLQTLNNQLKSVKTPKESDVLKFEELRMQYVTQKETFTRYSEEQTKKYDDQILGQLTEYIKDYGLENKYEFLFGANGDGSILYATENKDITGEVIKYINNSYQGKN